MRHATATLSGQMHRHRTKSFSMTHAQRAWPGRVRELFVNGQEATDLLAGVARGAPAGRARRVRFACNVLP
jgi:hypothetical protein